MTDFIKQTSTDSASPFSVSVSGNFKSFSDFYAQNRRFVANFEDDNHGMVAQCYLDGSGDVVVDEVISSTSSAYSRSIPAFSGTVTITRGVSTQNTYNNRVRNWNSQASSIRENVVISRDVEKSTSNFGMITNRFYMTNFDLAKSGWFYGFGVSERLDVAGNYHVGVWSLGGEANGPNKLLATTGEVTHTNTSVDVDLYYDTSKSITSTTAANPVSVSCTGHGYSTGDIAYITDVTTMTEINKRLFSVTVIDADTFTLDDEDGTAYTAGTGGVAGKPVWLDAGEYACGIVADLTIKMAGSGSAQKHGNSFMGYDINMYQITGVYKGGSYGAFTDDPMGSGTLTRYNGTVVAIGFLECET